MSTFDYDSIMEEAGMDNTPLMYLDRYRAHLDQSNIAYYKPIRSRKLKVSARSVLPFEILFSKADPLGSEDLDAGQGEHQPASFPFGDAIIYFVWEDRYISEIITFKHLFYILYHYAFDIPMYWIHRGNLGESEMINEFERVSLNFPKPANPFEVADDDVDAIIDRKSAVEIYPIVVRPIKDDFAQSLKKVFLKELPNHDYDISSPEVIANFSLRSGEIFEYFLSASKYSSITVEKAREKLIDMNLDVTGLSDEDLKKRLDFVDGFLFHIFW